MRTIINKFSLVFLILAGCVVILKEPILHDSEIGMIETRRRSERVDTKSTDVKSQVGKNVMDEDIANAEDSIYTASKKKDSVIVEIQEKLEDGTPRDSIKLDLLRAKLYDLKVDAEKCKIEYIKLQNDTSVSNDEINRIQDRINNTQNQISNVVVEIKLLKDKLSNKVGDNE